MDFENINSPQPSTSTSVGQRRRKTPASRKSSPSRSCSSPALSTNSSQLKEMAVDALQSIQSRPKDRFSALGEYFAGVLRSLPPKQATFAERKMNRVFGDILDEASSLVSSYQFN